MAGNNASGLRRVHHSSGQGGSGGGGGGGSSASASRVEEEYIRNLQQQIYLLELETRYLKTNNGERPDNQNILEQQPVLIQQQQLHQSRTHLSQQQLSQQPLSRYSSHDISAGSSSAPLNDTIKTLKLKYVELQEAHKKEMKVNTCMCKNLSNPKLASSLSLTLIFSLWKIS